MRSVVVARRLFGKGFKIADDLVGKFLIFDHVAQIVGHDEIIRRFAVRDAIDYIGFGIGDQAHDFVFVALAVGCLDDERIFQIDLSGADGLFGSLSVASVDGSLLM